MKTITLTDDAYERLKSWKRDARESFSQVVLRAVPKRGTLGSLSDAIDKLPPLTDEASETMEAELRRGNEWKMQRDPWAT